jgi:N-acetylmuramoyl-L-alanine amidase
MTKKVKIDAGHGGHDGGAQGNGLSEKDLVLAIAKMTKEHLDNYEGVEATLTRDSDRFLTLSERAQLANRERSNLFVSIHINSSAGAAGDGFESYIYSGGVGESTVAAQNMIHSSIIQTGLFKDRGKKRANFAVLRETAMIAILTENGFINNPSNAKILKDQANLDKIAAAHARGIAEFLGLKRKAAPAKDPTREAGTLYKVQVGAFSTREAAEQYAAEIERQGHKTYIVEE